MSARHQLHVLLPYFIRQVVCKQQRSGTVREQRMVFSSCSALQED